MDRDTFLRVETEFHRLAPMEASARDTAIAELAGHDPALAREVARLLQADAVDSDKVGLDPDEVSDAVHSAIGLDVGDTVGPYTLITKLGSGGMGDVFAAEQTQPIERHVALKMLRWTADPRTVVARFDAERRTLALMEHPHIAKIYDAGVSDAGVPWFAMELVDGLPIDEYCDRHQLSIDERLELMIHICQAVRHAHRRGVVHRDLKPSNLLVTSKSGEPFPIVIDFGIAKAVAGDGDPGGQLTLAGAPVGTPEFMSPEQADGTLRNVDTRSDVFSLGVVLYQLLTGRLPFTSDDGTDAVRQLVRERDPRRPSTQVTGSGKELAEIARRRRTDPRSLRQHLRGDLDWITLRALEKSPDDRYESARDLAEDLERHLAHRPVQAAAPGLPYRVAKFARRNRLLTASAALVSLAIALGIGGLIWGLRTARHSEQEARTEAARARAATDFLVRMFEVADPTLDEPKDLTATGILEQGAARLESDELGQQPAVRAELLLTIGKVHRNLGLFSLSEEHLSEALSLWRGLPDQQTSELKTMLELGSTRAALDRGESAMALFQRVAADADAAGAPELAVQAQTAIAGQLTSDGRYQESFDIAEEALATPAVLPADEWQRFRVELLNIQANDLLYLGRFAEAEAIWRRVLEVQEILHGPDHPALASTLTRLGTVKKAQAQYAESEPFVRRALELTIVRFGERHPEVAARRRDLGETYRLTGDLVQAEVELAAALEIAREFFVPPTTAVSNIAYEMALTMIDANRPTEAKSHVLETLAVETATYGNDHPDVGVTHVGLAICERMLGSWRASHVAADEAARIFAVTLEPDHWLHGLPAMENSATYLAQGEPQAAEREALRARDLWQTALGPEHEYYLEASTNLIEARLQLGDVDNARRMATETFATARRITGEDGRITKRLEALRANISPTARTSAVGARAGD